MLKVLFIHGKNKLCGSTAEVGNGTDAPALAGRISLIIEFRRHGLPALFSQVYSAHFFNTDTPVGTSSSDRRQPVLGTGIYSAN